MWHTPHSPLLACACALPSGPVAFCCGDHWTLNVLYALMTPLCLDTCPGQGRVCDGAHVLFVNHGLGILTYLLDLRRESCGVQSLPPFLVLTASQNGG